ncbi:uncharacterized protein K489DRAFT_90919 [Dissoconium aciculare CBS 342.82]|uniref:BCAS2 family protein n=1 Tax=Dissoconium aciculare CBS 342.82 TaxID=1314786 RepID=A0A6J3LRW4_9PEZI|nr:uncharacterized protein K489DRAFT_90919 [Dissoconium aciculare CBS 342.82]KAF1818540.1 hypothetical protein K489DRAFT_90919 [Dissoconium aciculare CBS 342.82]
MPLITSAVVALPNIDANKLTPSQLQSANDLVLADLASSGVDTNIPHPSIPNFPEAQFTPLIAAAHARLAASEPKTSALDLSRYEALDTPSSGSDSQTWTTALRRAATSAQYLRARETNLGLLEAYGKNAWLVGNSHLEDELKTLEKEVAEKRIEMESVAQERRESEAAVAAEMQSLENTWRQGVGRMLETQAAAEKLRLEILERKRQGATV